MNDAPHAPRRMTSGRRGERRSPGGGSTETRRWGEVGGMRASAARPYAIEIERWTPCPAESSGLGFTRSRGGAEDGRVQNRAMNPMSSARGCTQVRESNQLPAGDWDDRSASFDKLRMRDFLRATKIFPHPELVEGRRLVLQRCVHAIDVQRAVGTIHPACAAVRDARRQGPRTTEQSYAWVSRCDLVCRWRRGSVRRAREDGR